MPTNSTTTFMANWLAVGWIWPDSDLNCRVRKMGWMCENSRGHGGALSNAVSLRNGTRARFHSLAGVCIFSRAGSAGNSDFIFPRVQSGKLDAGKRNEIFAKHNHSRKKDLLRLHNWALRIDRRLQKIVRKTGNTERRTVIEIVFPLE